MNSKSIPSSISQKTEEPPSLSDSLSVEEAARYCQTSIWSIHRRIKAGELKTFRAGGRSIRINKEKLLGFMRENNIPIPNEWDRKLVRFLIVDDDDKMVNTLLRYFHQKTQWTIETASSGFRAGGLIETFKPHVILLDLMLGDINGKEVLRVLRNNPVHASVKVIAISGFVKEREIKELLELGFDAFFAKPFSVTELLGKIQALLQQEVISLQ